jgi:tetratricopeptide (TPR) repeat protein
MDTPTLICQRFAQYYLYKLQSAADDFLTGQEEIVVGALTRLDADLAQIKQAQALLSSYAAHDIELAQTCLDYSGITNLLLSLTLSVDEQIAWCSAALSAARLIDDQARVRTLLFRLGNLYVDSGRFDQGTPYLQELLTLAQAAQASRDEAKAWMGFADIAYHRGNHAEAQQLFETAYALLKALNDRSDVLGVLLLNLSSVYAAQGQHELSLQTVQETAEFLREKKDLYHLCNALNNMGSEYHALGRYAEASAALDEGIQLARQLGDEDTLGYLLANLGLVSLSMGNRERAQPYLEESVSILRAHDNAFAALAISGFLFHASMTVDNLDSSYQQLCDLIAEAVTLKMAGNVLSLLTAVARWYFLADQPVRCLELLDFVAPRPELDSEWLPFISRLRDEVAAVHPGLAHSTATLPARSLEQILAEILAPA